MALGKPRLLWIFYLHLGVHWSLKTGNRLTNNWFLNFGNHYRQNIFVLETDSRGSCVMVYAVMGGNKLSKVFVAFVSAIKRKN